MGKSWHAILHILYPFWRSKPVCAVDWRRADLPGATKHTPCREHQRRTCAPAERPRRGPTVLRAGWCRNPPALACNIGVAV